MHVRVCVNGVCVNGVCVCTYECVFMVCVCAGMSVLI